MEKMEIQKQLQLSDIEAAKKLRKTIDKNPKIFSAIKKRYIIPLYDYLHKQKGNRLFTLLNKMLSAEDLENIFGVKEIKEGDFKSIAMDIARHIDDKKDFETLKKKKFIGTGKKDFKEALTKIEKILTEKQNEIEVISKEFDLRVGQEFALTTFHIASIDMAYVALNLAIEIGYDSEYHDDPEDEEDGYPNTVQNVSRKFGEAIEDQLAIEETDTEELNGRGYDEMLLHLQSRHLPEEIMMHLGMWSIKHLEDVEILNRYKVDEDGAVTQVVDLHNRDKQIDDEQTHTLIGYTESFKEYIEKIKDRLTEQVSLHYDPMAVAPMPWEGVVGGGFLQTSNKYKLPIRKVWSQKEHETLAASADSFSPEIYKAINTIQQIPFSINEKLFYYLEDLLKSIKANLKEKRSSRNEILSKERKAYKKYQKLYRAEKDDDDLDQEDLDHLKKKFLKKRQQFFDKRNLYQKENTEIRDLKLKAEKISEKLAVVKRLQREGIGFVDNIYFVWQMDFRGRIYPVQTHLNPQSDDVARSLLLFGEEKRVDERGVWWMKVHGANLYGKDGLDKKPFADRVAWVDAHTEEIIQITDSPHDSLLLNEAEDPFQFLAFCYEYACYLDSPDDFKSALPIGVDGSNNGLQHISALYRDRKSAEYVNVLSNSKETPEDIYGRVAEYTKATIKKEHQKFHKEKSKFIQRDGLYLMQKEDAKALPENFITPKMIDILTEELDKLKKNTAKERKARIKKLLKKELSSAPSDKNIPNRLEQWCKKSEYDAQKFMGIFDEEKERISGESYYRNNDGHAVETIISPHNFINDKLLDLIDRDLVKPNVMTDSYGTEIRTKQDQINKKLRSLREKGILSIEDYYHIRLLANYIGAINDRSIDEISEASARYMNWMQKTASKIHTKGSKKINRENPISWTTPLGLRITQVKYKKEELAIETRFGQDRVTMQILNDKEQIDINKQSSGFAPNYIHSLDATHLLMTVLDATQRGIDALMTIHDSFSTHAVDVDRLLDSLKEQFIILHQEPLMEKLKSELEEHFAISLDPIEYIDENFPLEEVRESKYFFA